VEVSLPRPGVAGKRCCVMGLLRHCGEGEAMTHGDEKGGGELWTNGGVVGDNDWKVRFNSRFNGS